MVVMVGRKSVEADELNMDVLDQACVALQLTDEQCAIIREAAEELCKEKREKGKRQPSEFNIFIGKCVKEEGADPITERFKRCVSKWKAEKKK
jgi:hypothetical protein